MNIRKYTKFIIFILLAAFIVIALVSYNMLAINHGEIDYSLINEGKPPLYAKYYASASDGGTAFYKGHGYSVYDVHSHHEENGVWGYLVGPRISYSIFVFGGKNRESLHFRSDPNQKP